uniref:phospholipase A1 n=1 Tax=Cotesia chilonis TaxID=89804 RepID=A0A1J0M5H0_9HYME|nr:phospholipase A1 [Cotesia chilonis]
MSSFFKNLLLLLLVKVCIADYGDNIHFELFTRIRHFERINITPGHDNLLETTFNISKPTKVIIHGFISNSKASHLVKIQKNYLFKFDCNVIMVDWSYHARNMYITAIGLSRIVAIYVARLFLVLMKNGVQDIHAIGHSLGAHIPAIASSYLGKHKLNRITGLDPARPLLGIIGLDAKLDSSDALFVDVYHSSILGRVDACGHVDFIMNSGKTQPGCRILDLVCHHARASLYFAESITSMRGFWGYPENLTSEILSDKVSKESVQEIAGEFVNRSIRGVYYVPTNARKPFAKGPYF